MWFWVVLCSREEVVEAWLIEDEEIGEELTEKSLLRLLRGKQKGEAAREVNGVNHNMRDC